jgi:hypothetical protein
MQTRKFDGSVPWLSDGRLKVNQAESRFCDAGLGSLWPEQAIVGERGQPGMLRGPTVLDLEFRG